MLCPTSAKLSFANVPVIVNNPFIDAFMIKNPSIAANPAVPLSLFANPIATPTAKITGKF